LIFPALVIAICIAAFGFGARAGTIATYVLLGVVVLAFIVALLFGRDSGPGE
jgi:hypothetical protein